MFCYFKTALMKLTKNQLVKSSSQLNELGGENIEFCKSAPGKIDVMKSEKIAYQKLIIETQQGQMQIFLSRMK